MTISQIPTFFADINELLTGLVVVVGRGGGGWGVFAWAIACMFLELDKMTSVDRCLLGQGA